MTKLISFNDISIMILLYGLGNNHSKYLKTKHNIGRIIVELLTQKLGLEFQKKNSFWYVKSDKISLLYSNGYMNHSGEALIDFCNYFKIQPDLLMIMQDDSDQLVGTQKLSLGGGTAGHNGIISVYQHLSAIKLENEDVLRLKIGIRPVDNRAKSETFVLSSIHQSEQEYLQKLADNIFKNLDLIEQNSIPLLQNIVNTKLV